MNSPPPDPAPRRWPLFVTAAVVVATGALHLARPEPYLRIMPPGVPWPSTMVAVSGWAEIVGGAGLLISRLRRPAGWGLIALLIAVFPANVYMAARPERFASIPPAALWLRLPLQGVLIWWVWRVAIRRRVATGTSAA